MTRFIAVSPVFQVTLLGIMIVALNGGCSGAGNEVKQAGGDEVKQAGEAVRQHAAKQNPAFRAPGRSRFSGTIDGAASGDVCACMTVCDSKGENCTGCSCSPKNCGSC